ncbi:hypothetical protein ANTQUA_LOCUS9538 [Anthophora quadrimaculata]
MQKIGRWCEKRKEIPEFRSLRFNEMFSITMESGILDGSRELGNMKRARVGTRSVFKIRMLFPAKAEL